MDFDSFFKLQKNYPRTVGNDFMMPGDLKQRFSSGLITVSADENALLIFEQRHGFTKLHFRLINKSAALPPLKICKSTDESINEACAPSSPIPYPLSPTPSRLKTANDGKLAAFLTYREDRYQDIAADWLLRQGFAKTKTVRRHTAAAINCDLPLDDVVNATADEAYAMFGEYFSAVEADMPRPELFEGAICVRSKDGKPIGALYMGQTLIVAVSPEARGKGVGRKLYKAYAGIRAREGKKPTFHEWISPDNAASLAMFKKLGFTPDKVMTETYVLEFKL